MEVIEIVGKTLERFDGFVFVWCIFFSFTHIWLST
jgi:hypothetical protein